MEKITSRKNPLIAHIRKLGTSRTYREENREFLCDGLKLLEDAVRSDIEIASVLTAAQIPFPLPLNTRVYYSDQRLIDYISSLNNAQDTLFTCRIPQSYAVNYSELKIPNFEFADEAGIMAGTHILLDGIQDPGNVGAIIRTANAFGIISVILAGGCADPYNPKTVRASMGAIFRQRINYMTISELTALRDNGAVFIGTAIRNDCKDIRGIDLKNTIIAIGSEGHGLSEGVMALCCEKIKIPISMECESLNAAVSASIIMWEALRQTL